MSDDNDLVDGVVGEVDVVVAQVLHLVGVALRGEPHQPIFKYIKSERLNAGHQDVDADVKLETVYEHWIVDVLLNNHLAILRWNLFCKKCRVRVENSFSGINKTSFVVQP